MGIESQHWYKPDGSPFYECAAKDGSMRPVTLRDARKVNAVPSVTTVLQVIAKPQLESWKCRQYALSALTLPRHRSESDTDFLARIATDAAAQAKAAAEEGSRVHDAIEQAWRGNAVPDQYRKTVDAAMTAIREAFPDVTDWTPEASFAHGGFGGRVDLHSPSTGVVIDYKGKDGDFGDGKRLAYDQHYQLAAYQHGLQLTKAKCANLFFSRTHPGKISLHVWEISDVDAGWCVFSAALALWQELKDYRP